MKLIAIVAVIGSCASFCVAYYFAKYRKAQEWSEGAREQGEGTLMLGKKLNDSDDWSKVAYVARKKLIIAVISLGIAVAIIGWAVYSDILEINTATAYVLTAYVLNYVVCGFIGHKTAEKWIDDVENGWSYREVKYQAISPDAKGRNP